MAIETASVPVSDSIPVGDFTPVGDSEPDGESAHLRELREKIAHLKNDMRSIAELSGRMAGDTLVSLTDEMIKGLTYLTDGAADQSRTVVRRLQDAVHDHPVKSMAFSLGIGAFVACLVMRR